MFHSELINSETDFLQLQELDFSFNFVYQEENLWYLTQTQAINLLIITGNPFALKTSKQGGYARLEAELQKNLAAVVINESALVDDQGFYLKRKAGQKQQALPYPNPIKLSTSYAKDIKGDYLNAEVMRNGIALHITDIHPDNNIESEIFPKELTREAQSKDVFTPPNHQQMRFTENAKEDFPPAAQSSNDAFFITEDIRDEDYGPENNEDGHDAIEEERSYATEGDESNKNKEE